MAPEQKLEPRFRPPDAVLADDDADLDDADDDDDFDDVDDDRVGEKDDANLNPDADPPSNDEDDDGADVPEDDADDDYAQLAALDPDVNPLDADVRAAHAAPQLLALAQQQADEAHADQQLLASAPQGKGGTASDEEEERQKGRAGGRLEAEDRVQARDQKREEQVHDLEEIAKLLHLQQGLHLLVQKARAHVRHQLVAVSDVMQIATPQGSTPTPHHAAWNFCTAVKNGNSNSENSS
ncbi:hypothetical protein FIBSPDRAFT_898174 [Athelia psychrophila]|uniref:Uncharacterized protein n=1 Tax=Athelia psychrophila TaxID=1759441 RepID=A0A166B9D5_9AGAM|nr:hypothetical protein FIBSPDRAFT_898174 [Fibularhizoctonia sp. CBS 109695]